MLLSVWGPSPVLRALHMLIKWASPCACHSWQVSVLSALEKDETAVCPSALSGYLTLLPSMKLIPNHPSGNLQRFHSSHPSCELSWMTSLVLRPILQNRAQWICVWFLASFTLPGPTKREHHLCYSCAFLGLFFSPHPSSCSCAFWTGCLFILDLSAWEVPVSF